MPGAPPDLAEESYQVLRQSFPKLPSERRIFCLEYSRNGGSYTAQVGEVENEYGWFVLAIFDYGGLYVVACVVGEIHEGQSRLAPEPKHHFIGQEAVIRAVDFEP